MKDRHLPHDWFAAPIPANVEFGERCWIYSSYAFLHFRSRQKVGLRMGHDVGVYIGGMFEVGPEGTVEVGDFTALVGPTINTNGTVKIGNYVFIAHEVVIADHFAAVPADAGMPGRPRPKEPAGPRPGRPLAEEPGPRPGRPLAEEPAGPRRAPTRPEETAGLRASRRRPADRGGRPVRQHRTVRAS